MHVCICIYVVGCMHLYVFVCIFVYVGMLFVHFSVFSFINSHRCLGDDAPAANKVAQTGVHQLSYAKLSVEK